MHYKLTASKPEQLSQDRMAIHVDAQGTREAYLISPHTPTYRRTILEDLKFFDACGLRLSVPRMLTHKSISQRISDRTPYKFTPCPIPIKVSLNLQNSTPNQTHSRIAFYYNDMPYKTLQSTSSI